MFEFSVVESSGGLITSSTITSVLKKRFWKSAMSITPTLMEASAKLKTGRKKINSSFFHIGNQTPVNGRTHSTLPKDRDIHADLPEAYRETDQSFPA